MVPKSDYFSSLSEKNRPMTKIFSRHIPSLSDTLGYHVTDHPGQRACRMGRDRVRDKLPPGGVLLHGRLRPVRCEVCLRRCVDSPCRILFEEVNNSYLIKEYWIMKFSWYILAIFFIISCNCVSHGGNNQKKNLFPILFSFPKKTKLLSVFPKTSQ